MSDIVFMDTETLGLHVDAPIWEFAAIRRDENGLETRAHCFIEHKPGEWVDTLPEPFKQDYRQRFSADRALPKGNAAHLVYTMLKGAHVIGAVPSFDTERLARLLKLNGIHDIPWHYHLVDVENVVVGYLAAKGELMKPPWKSDVLSQAIGVDPEEFDRHTAMGDVLWTRAQWDVVMGNA